MLSSNLISLKCILQKKNIILYFLYKKTIMPILSPVQIQELDVACEKLSEEDKIRHVGEYQKFTGLHCWNSNTG